MRIKTGKGAIGLAPLLGIWSVSALTSLPGLAVSPILDDLSKIFGNVDKIEVDMLTSLPSLLIIPFILLAGRLTARFGYMRLLAVGLSLFLLSGMLYLFCDTMGELIAVSALLGIGAGTIIPLSTALISRFFSGEARTRQFGYSSAITNVTLVLATALTGYLADIEWHLSFVVYLLPAVSLMFVPVLWQAEQDLPVENVEQLKRDDGVGDYIAYRPLLGYMFYYLLITYLTVIVSFNLPFLLASYGYGSGVAGDVISLFFLAIMLPGFFLGGMLRLFGKRVLQYVLLLIGVGLLMVTLSSSLWVVIIGAVIAGLAYGVAQPYLYDLSTKVASPRKVSFALALLMTMNYVAILVAPFVVDVAQHIFAAKTPAFAFVLNGAISLLSFLFMFLLQKKNGYKRNLNCY